MRKENRDSTGGFGRACPGGQTEHERIHLRASRICDTMNPPVHAGSRSPGRVSRHLLYRASDFDVDIRIETDTEPAGLRLTGQILKTGGAFPENASVRLESQRAAYETRTSRIGEFSFDGVHREHYDLSVILPRFRITVSDISHE